MALTLADIKRGTLTFRLDGEWASAKRVPGIVLDVKRMSEKILVYENGKISWHTADEWHLKNFWKIA